MLLCLNISNSTITIGAFENDDLIFTTAVSSDDKRTAAEYAITFKSIFELSGLDINSINGSIISCVVPSLASIIKEAISFIYKGKIFIVGPKLKNGLKIKSENPSQIGSSLICQSVALNKKYPMPCLLISMGTALSMFALDKQGTFIGGSILPGIKMSAKALNENTAQLPQIDLSYSPKSVIGTNTTQNVQSGLFFGTVSIIDGMINRFKNELGNDLCCVATGDISKTILETCQHDIVYDEHLIMDGLKIIYDKNNK